VKGRSHGPIWGTIRIYSERLRKTTNVLIQDSRSPGRHSTLTLPKFKSTEICLFLFFILLFFPLWRYSPNLGLGLPPWNSQFYFGLLDLRHSVGLLGRMISSSQGLYLYINTEKRARARAHAHTHTHTPNIHALSGIRTDDPGFWANEDSVCLRPLGCRDRLESLLGSVKHKSRQDILKLEVADFTDAYMICHGKIFCPMSCF
jgi:hypothetical protein